MARCHSPKWEAVLVGPDKRFEVLMAAESRAVRVLAS